MKYIVNIRRHHFLYGLGGLMLALFLFLAQKPPLLEDVTFSRAVYDRHGALLRLTLSKDEKYRLYMPLDRISASLKEAVLLHEDQFFYQHPGINPGAMARAFIQTYLTGGRRSGASTVSMQLARLKSGISSRHIPGKLWQMLCALRIELHYSKDEILEAYLNLAPYGRNIEGVGAASLIYFKRQPHALSLPESLSLALIPQSPARRTLSQKIELQKPLTEARRNLFSKWAEIHPKDASLERLIALPVAAYRIEDLPFEAPHAVMSALSRHPDMHEITLQLDLSMQKRLSTLLSHYVEARRGIGINNAAAMLVDFRTMQVRAHIGSADFFDLLHSGQVDGTRAKRSPGSTLKPLLYALAFDQGLIHPMSMLRDAATRFGAFNPENFDRAFNGPLSARDALMTSRNIPALEIADKLRAPGFYGFLKSLGVSGLQEESRYGLSLVLGGAEVSMRELATYYAMLAGGGILRPLQYDMASAATAASPQLSPEASFMALDALKDTARPAIRTGGPEVYWKTGTSNGFRDAWTAGVFGPYVLVVWVGDFSGKSNPALVGVRTAAPLFFEMVDVLAKSETLPELVAALPAHLKLKRVEACALTGDIDNPLCPVRVKSWFIPGKSPIRSANILRQVLVDKRTGKQSCSFIKGVTEYRVMEFWPSDLRDTFAKAGIHKPELPDSAEKCESEQMAAASSLKISSPSSNIQYSMRLEAPEHERIPFSATTSGEAKEIFWFVNNRLVGRSSPSKAWLWKPQPGKYVVRAVDNLGHADSTKVQISLTP